jgi:hypothetical protein
VAAVIAAAITAALFLRDSERDHVSAYIEDVNEVQQRSATRFGSVNQALEQFELSADAAAEDLPELRRAAATLTSLRVQVQRIEAPEDARLLRARLIAFFKQQEAVARELVGVAVYLPKLSKAERPLPAVNRRLRSGLSDTSSLETQANVVQRYARELARVAAALDAIEPPTLLRASHRAYVQQLRSYAAASRALQSGIRSNDQTKVDAAIERLRVASVAPPGAAKAQSAAIVAFNERVTKVNELGLAVEKERRRLERDL